MGRRRDEIECSTWSLLPDRKVKIGWKQGHWLESERGRLKSATFIFIPEHVGTSSNECADRLVSLVPITGTAMDPADILNASHQKGWIEHCRDEKKKGLFPIVRTQSKMRCS